MKFRFLFAAFHGCMCWGFTSIIYIWKINGLNIPDENSKNMWNVAR